MANLLFDLRQSLRTIRRAPGFTLVAVLAIAFGIAINSAVFTLLNAVVFRPLPVEDADRVVTVYQRMDGDGGRNTHGDSSYFSRPEYEAYRDQNRLLSGVAAYSTEALTIGGTNPRFTTGDLVSCNYFDVLTAKMRLGRGFSPEECGAPGANPVAVIGFRLWQRQFAGDPSILGKTIVLNGTAFTVVGVAPEGFSGASLISAEVWAPLTMQEQWIPNRAFLGDANLSWLQIIGRLKPGTSLAQTRADLSVIAARLDADHAPRRTTLFVDRAALMNIPGGHTAVIAAGAIVLALVSLVLLIACANLANLLMARAVGRQKEIAIRLAVGASRKRLIGQLLVESLTLSATGGVLGLLGAWGTLRIALPLLLARLPEEARVMMLNPSPDVRIIANSIALSVITGIAFGLLPALQASRVDLNSVLKDSGAVMGRGRSRFSVTARSVLVTVQVAVCLVLLLIAGLLARGLQAARDVDPGFEMTNMASASFDLNRQGYDAARSAVFHQTLQEKLAAQGIDVALVHPVPLSSSRNGLSFRIEGRDRPITVSNATVSANYFQLLNIPMVRGRAIDERDILSQAAVVVMSEATVKRIWPDEDPIGKQIRFEQETALREVIGVARDIHSLGLTESDETFAYLPVRGDGYRESELVARSGRGAGVAASAIREAVRSIDPNVLVQTSVLADNLDIWQLPSRISAAVGFALGIAGLLLASLGIYGVVALAVSQRTREIGIRVSLGALRGDVLRLILLQTLRPAAAGVAIGLAISAALSRVLTSLLFGVSPLDPVVFGGVSLFLATVAMVASYIPARRATRVDPMIALRHQ